MDWVASIHQAIQYIEEHLREELTIREIAQQAALAPFYFQKGFSMLCGMTVGDYIPLRNCLQLMEAEFDDDLFFLGQLHPFDEADQQFPTGQCRV